MAAVRSFGLRATLLRTAPVVILAGLVGLAVPLALRVSDRLDQDRQRVAVLAAARDEVTSLMNISYATAGRDLGRVVAGATGDLRRRYEVQRSHAAQLASTKSVVTGSVASTALLWLHRSDDTARAVVAAAGTDSTAGAAPSLRHYRWVLTLRQIGGHWLVSDAAVEGLPS